MWNQILEFSSSRGNTKGIEYALLYGASDEKLGTLIDVEGCLNRFASEDKLLERGWIKDVHGKWRHKQWNPKKESLTLKQAQCTVCGSIIRMRIMSGLQPLGKAIEKFVKLSEKGYLKALDGRKLNCRSSHSAFNLRLQSTGSIICKTAMILTMEKLYEKGLVVVGKDHDPKKHVELYIFYHDELQMGVPEHLYDPDKVFNIDFSEYDLTTKEGKKAAKAKAESVVSRFSKREYRTKGFVWSRPKINLEEGTATISHTVVADISTQAFLEAGLKYGFTIPVLAEWDSGQNWYDCH